MHAGVGQNGPAFAKCDETMCSYHNIRNYDIIDDLIYVKLYLYI